MLSIASIESMLQNDDPLNVILLTIIACAISSVVLVSMALISNAIVGMRERKQERKQARAAVAQQSRAKVKEKITAGQEKLASHQEKLATLSSNKEERAKQSKPMGG